MRTVVGIQIAARAYAEQWFTDGAHPSSVVTTETDPGPNGARDLKAKIMNLVHGNREPLVMPKGTTLAPYQSDPASSSLVEILTQSTNDIAQFFLMPPEMVGGNTGSSMTYSTTEGQAIRVLQFALRYWMRKLELAMSRAVRPQAIYAKFDENDFVRTDLRTKVQAAVLASGGPIWTPNEARYADDRPPLPGGDVLRERGGPATGVTTSATTGVTP
jgi:HK97 family phage portal protein